MNAHELLASTRTVLLVDWPSRDVPDTLARSGRVVVSSDGPGGIYNVYELIEGEIDVRPISQPPPQVDLIYSYRPIGELPEILDLARTMGARVVWFQCGRDPEGNRDPRGCWLSADDSARARSIVEQAGLGYVESPYIVEAVRSRH